MDERKNRKARLQRREPKEQYCMTMAGARINSAGPFGSFVVEDIQLSDGAGRR